MIESRFIFLWSARGVDPRNSFNQGPVPIDVAISQKRVEEFDGAPQSRQADKPLDARLVCAGRREGSFCRGRGRRGEKGRQQKKEIQVSAQGFVYLFGEFVTPKRGASAGRFADFIRRAIVRLNPGSVPPASSLTDAEEVMPGATSVKPVRRLISETASFLIPRMIYSNLVNP